jgi:early secretory antigenic target protein ESAT-6
MGSPSSSGFSGGGTLDGQIKVSFGGLDAGSEAIKASAAKIDTTLNDLKTDLQPLSDPDTGWTGEAAGLYQQHQTKWNQAAIDLQQVLASIATALHVANEDYMDGERQNSGRWT